MATYTSGSITYSGVSGVDMDFDTMIDQLYEIESMQANKLIEWREDWKIRRDAFTEVRQALVTMQTALTAINSTDKFLVKSANSSDSGVVGCTAGSDAVAGSYTIDVNQTATNSIWSLGTGLAAKDSVVNNSGQEGTFAYTYKGETRTVKVPNGTTLEGLKNIINNDSENLGVRVQLVQSGDEIVFQLSGLDTGSASSLYITDTTNLNGLKLEEEATWNYLGGSTNELTSWTTYDSYTDPINTTETAKTFGFEVNGETYSVKLEAGGSLTDLCAAINEKTGDSGVTAQIAMYTHSITGEITYGLHLSTTDASDVVTVGGGTLEGYGSMIEATNWHVQQGQNAEIRINGWPNTGWLEVGSNAATDVVDGLTFNLRSEGKATITVELDTEAIEENVQTFVDAVNEFRTLILDLTKVDESKTVLDPEYAETQSEMQMGSALTGNYGIQLMSSNLKQAVSNQAKGFTYMEEIEGKMYGDMFSSLSQIGIITDTDESSPTFGLLVINTETKDSSGNNMVQSTATMTLKDALEKDAEAVARLFSANNDAKSHSSNFGVNSLVETITKPGNYDVSYTTDAGGNITNATINGKDAKVDGSTISLVRTPSSSDTGVATVSHDGNNNYGMEVKVDSLATKAASTVQTECAAKTDSINSTGSAIDFSYEYNGVTRTFEVEPGTTLNDLVKGINSDPANPGVTARVAASDDDPPKYNLVLDAKATGDNGAITVSATGGELASAAKTETAGTNAKYKAWNPLTESEPTEWTESATNSASLASGLSITLRGTGSTTITAQKHNDADGIILDIYNLTPNATMEGSFSIRQGKVNELLDMLKGTDGLLGENGTLKILENNYDEIIKNIETKIQKEDERLQKWLRTTRNRFSRLETVLANYQNLQASIESQIEQLGSSSS